MLQAMSKKSVYRLAQALSVSVFLAFLVAFGPARADQSSGREAVGEVLFAVGGAYRHKAQRQAPPETLKRGERLRVGDAIQTQEGAHVHIRFVDGAFLSVRPNSRLKIEQYQFDASKPQQSQVKFMLEDGTARSITGRAGEAAKERFRLNTPVAAVGVRGTDFVVLTDPKQSSVLVNSGAVVVAPLGQQCTAEGLGPCTGGLSQLLSAEMAGVYARIESGGVRMLPINEVKPKSPHAEEPPSLASRSNRFRQVDAAQAAQIATPGVLIAGDVSFHVNNPATNADLGSGASQASSELFGDQRSKQVTEAIVKVVNPGAHLPPSSLAWGRWALDPIPGETNPAPIITKPEYSRMLVSDGVNAIFGPADARSIVPRMGQFDFVLRDARASLMGPEGPTAGRVHSGQLSIDFSEGSFSTFLRASHDAVDGMILVQGSGPLRGDGLFQTLNPSAQDANIVGVVANAGKEAVYVFSKPVTTRSGSPGSFFGLSRWGR